MHSEIKLGFEPKNLNTDHSDMHVLGIFGCYIKYYLALKFLFVFQIDLTIE